MAALSALYESKQHLVKVSIGAVWPLPFGHSAEDISGQDERQPDRIAATSSSTCIAFMPAARGPLMSAWG